MKVLVVSWFFPPANTIGAVRIGNLAKFLLSQGHDVRCVAGARLPYPQTLDLDFPEDRIAYARWADVNAPARWLTGFVKKLLFRGGAKTGSASPSESSGAPAPTQNRSRSNSLVARLNGAYMSIFNWPDSRVGWLPFALWAGRRMLSYWRPDVVFVSGPPFTTLLVGYGLSRLYRLPLVVEFRDRWADDPYYPPPNWRLRIDRFAERAIVRRAVALTTVSEPWAVVYREKFNKPVAVIHNGFDEAVACHTSSPGHRGESVLRIVYTGGIYPGRRDPSPLFAALRELGDQRAQVRVEFFGTNPAHIWPLSEHYGVSECVTMHEAVDHDRAIHEQRHADVLLLMQWNDPKEQGNVPGKFFEYLGALRPILVLGLEDGVPATLVRKLNAGVYCGDTGTIIQALRNWLQMKRNDGEIPSLPETARRGFARVDQYAQLSDFLSGVISETQN